MGTQRSNTDIVFLSAVRTPFGTYGGALKDISAIDLTVFAAKAALERAGVDGPDVQHAVFGNVVVLRAPADLKTRDWVWGAPAAASLTTALKSELDPGGLLGAGRGPL